MRSYVEILTELRETIENDIIPTGTERLIMNHLEKLEELLWPYSD